LSLFKLQILTFKRVKKWPTVGKVFQAPYPLKPLLFLEFFAISSTRADVLSPPGGGSLAHRIGLSCTMLRKFCAVSGCLMRSRCSCVMTMITPD